MAISNESLFSAKDVPGPVRTELETRALKTWNPMNGQAKTWIHVMSLAEGSPSPISTYDNFSLAYDKYNRPKKLIQSLKVGSKGEYGTTKSATLELILFSDEELNDFASSYMIPDMSVRIQWGWSVSATGAQKEQPILDTLYDNDALSRMQRISETSPSYEGFQGRVVSWNVTLDPKDNAWLVTLEMVGAANSVTETSISQTTDNCKCKKKVTGQTDSGDNKTEDVVEESSALQAALLELYDDPEKITAVQAGTNGYSGEFVAETIRYPGFSRDESGKEDSDGLLWIDADLDAEETYVSWGTVESLLSYFSAQQLDGNGPVGFKVDSRGLTLKVPTQSKGRWFSADPRVCILPGGGLVFEEPTEWTDGLVIAAAAYIGAVVSFGALTGAGAAAGAALVSDPGYGTSSGNCFETDNKIKITDIRVSTIHLLKRLKEFETNKDTIMTALTTLLSDINKACGSPWELELIDVSIQAGVESGGVTQLATIDANAPEQTLPPFIFKATPGDGGFCREIKLELKMTDAMKTQALYGANGSDSESSIQSSGKTPCSSRFMQYTKELKRNTGKIEKPSEGENILQAFCKAMEICNESNEVEHPVDKLQKQAVGVNIDGARVYLESERRKGEMAALKGQGISAYCATAALPMGFSATLTGVGGFRWGQTITCDRLPDDMQKLVKYQVTTVEHNVTPDDWTTSIDTVARKRY